MIKKPTLILLLVAIALGVGVYYFDYKRSENAKPIEDSTKPAFSIQASDVKSLTLSRPARPGEPPIQIELQGGVWQIVQPFQTEADQPSVQGIVTGLANARIAQTESGSPDRLKAFGLDAPEVSVEFQLQNGSKHSLLLGNKDFTGVSSYGIVDGGKSVSLLPESLLVSADKSFDDLRDHAVLHISSGTVASFDIKTHSGEIAATKYKTGWKFSKPADTLADEDSVNALLTAVGNAKATAIVAEKPTDLAKYGLAAPAITFTTVDDKGAQSTLLVGKKDGDDYDARDASRPTIFRVNTDAYKKLTQNYNDLRDKKVVHFDPNSINHVELQNANGAIALTRKSADEWTFEAPADQKGKSAGIEKIFSALADAKGDEVLDHPPADLLAKVAKPAVEVYLTDKDGKKLTVRFSKESGDFVYAQSSGGPTLYKLKKQGLDDLNLKAADLVF
jgi:hypothetical protein